MDSCRNSHRTHCPSLTNARSSVLKSLEFLLQIGLAVESPTGFEPGPSQIRIGNDSHHILKHHSNWRIQSIESLEREDLSDLHYSAVISISESDIPRLKDAILEALEAQLKTIKASKEEEVFCYAIDFFSLKK